MPAIFDTSVGVLLLRRNAPAAAGPLLDAARIEIDRGAAVLPAVARAELLVGERDPEKARRLATALERVPTAVLPPEAASNAGAMGAFLRSQGAVVPFPDLLIAATALWLELPLLTWDGDYARARRVAHGCDSNHPGAELWRGLDLHPASLGAPTAG